MFLFLGWANLIWQPIALVYGRRGVYVLSSFLCIWPVLWSAYSTTAGEWYAHRIILGIFAAPIESLPEVSVPDLFFAHNRGGYMGIYAFLLFGGNFLAPFLAGWIDVAGGWRWTMFFGAIVQAATTIIIYFWMEETMYFRATVEGEEDTVHGVPSSGSSGILPSEDAEKGVTKKGADFTTAPAQVQASVTTTNQPSTPKKSFWKKLSLFTKMPGRPSNKAMFVMMWRPLPIMYHFPTVSWAGLYVHPYPLSLPSSPSFSQTPLTHPQRLRHLPLLVQRPQRHHILHPLRRPLQFLLGPRRYCLPLAPHRRRPRRHLERLVHRSTRPPPRAPQRRHPRARAAALGTTTVRRALCGGARAVGCWECAGRALVWRGGGTGVVGV
jgi:hypothetical protein